MTTRLQSRIAAGLAVAVVLLSAACSDGDDTTSPAGSEVTTAPVPTDKAGNSNASGPRTLVLTTFSQPERPRGSVAARFADELAASDSDLTLDVRYGVDESIAEFTSGAADMILIPAMQMEMMGVDSFRALSMPLLIDDDTQADRVAVDPVVDEMMAGLDAIDATGLMLAPVGPLHLGLQGDQRLRSLDQLDGAVRVFPQTDLYDGVYQAMGTTAVVLNGDEWDAAVRTGEVVAKESPTALWGNGPLPVVMAANVTMSYDFAVLVIRNDTLAELSADQVETLTQVAAAAEQRTIDERPREDTVFRDECARGADLRAAPITLWAQIGRAVDDFILEQLADPATKASYDAIKRAAGQRTLAWPNDCDNGVIVPYEPPLDPTATLADGTYRVDGRSVEQMLVSGVGANTATSGNEVDYWELVVADGVADLVFHYADGRIVSNPSDYSVSGGIVTFRARPDKDGLNGAQALTVTDDGFLLEPLPTDDVAQLNDIYDVAGLGGFEWTKVG